MTNQKIKYSLLIPARNGVKYLPTCVDTIIGQSYNNYELLISDDHSTDETEKYLSSLKHPNIKVLQPPESLSMAEHWEWLLSQSCGEWVIFIGQDDGIQPYFFSLADRLTSNADKKGIRTIMSQRAYFFWKGCETMYGDVAVDYLAIAKVKIKNCKTDALLALLGFKTYFELPEMYTTSIFKRDIIVEAKKRQNGSLFVTHPQDANLAAIACSLDKRYLFSLIPLGWVGSSPKSAGMAINAVFGDDQDSNNSVTEIKSVRVDYLEKTNNSKLKTHPLVGDFSFGSCPIYFWGSLLQTQNLRNDWINGIIKSKVFKTIMFGGVLVEVMKSKKLNVKFRLTKIKEIIDINQSSMKTVKIVSHIFSFLYTLYNIYKKIGKKLDIVRFESFSYRLDWEKYPETTMSDSSKEVIKRVIEKGMLEKI